MSEPNPEDKLATKTKPPTKPSELVAEVLEVDRQNPSGPSPVYPFIHGLLCGLKLGGL